MSPFVKTAAKIMAEHASVPDDWPDYLEVAAKVIRALSPLDPETLKRMSAATIDTYGNMAESFGVPDWRIKAAHEAFIRAASQWEDQ